MIPVLKAWLVHARKSQCRNTVVAQFGRNPVRLLPGRSLHLADIPKDNDEMRLILLQRDGARRLTISKNLVRSRSDVGSFRGRQ